MVNFLQSSAMSAAYFALANIVELYTMRLAVLSTVAALAGTISASAATVIVDFDTATSSTFNQTPYIENGFTFTPTSGHYDIFSGPTGNEFNIDNVSYGLTSVTVTYSGGTFSLGNIDIDSLSTAGAFLFTASNGATFSPTATGTFDAAFNNITSFTFQQTSGGFYSVDNLNFTTDVSAVPLPASAPMFGAALLALAGFGYGMNRWVAPKGNKAATAA